MNLKQLDAFRKVMSSGSMTAAAHDLNTTQPNISRLIVKLEAATGLQLFTRQGNRLVPTEAALAFSHEVERAYVGVHELADAAARIRRQGSGSLRVAAVPTLALGLLPRVVARVEERHPDMSFAIHIGSSATIAHWAASLFCDVGIIVHAGEARGIDIAPLYEVEAVCVLPASHALATRPVVTPADLADERFIVPPLGDADRSKIDEVFAAAGVACRVGIETPFNSIVCSLVGRGVGVGIVHPLVARDHARDGVIARRFQPAILMSAFLVFPQHRPRSAAAGVFERTFREMAEEALRGVPGGPPAR